MTSVNAAAAHYARIVTYDEFIAAWERLADAVRDYEPSVVVVVARKTARMQQVLALDFGVNVLTISDLALPFASDAVRGARVAVVDDVVNVGSTLTRAVARAEAAGAADVRAFAITKLNRSAPSATIEFVLDRELDRERLREFGRLVPRALRGYDKPYDLDFPLFRCWPAVPYATFDEVFRVFSDFYGEDSVYDVSTFEGAAAGVHRMTIDLPGGVGAHRKIRLYFSSVGHCHVAPLDIPSVLKTGPPSERSSPTARALYAAGAASLRTQNDDALARLRMYCESLALGQAFLTRHADVLRTPVDALDLDDATLVLGPVVRTLPLRELRQEAGDDATVARPSLSSPFLRIARTSGLLAAIRAKLDQAPLEANALAAFVACIETTADWVGADDPIDYRLDWPYRHDEVVREPYLRLHIGPTMGDLVELVLELLGRRQTEREKTRRELTRLLDRLVDAGAVVPTTATYEGDIYRIYRKGEGSARDLVSARIQNAFYEYQQETNNDLVATLMTKVLTIMSFSEEQDANPGVPPMAEQRGNVVAFPPSLLDDGGELFYYLRQTERLVDKR